MAARTGIAFLLLAQLFHIFSAFPTDHVVLEKTHDTGAWRELGWQMVGGVEPAEKLELTFAIKQRNLDLLEKIFWSYSDPASKEYGKQLSVDELTEIVSPSEESLGTVTEWLKSHGVDECKLTLNKDFLVCVLPASTAEELLGGVIFRTFRHEKLSKPLIRSLTHYSVPRKVAVHLDFIGGILRFPNVRSSVRKDPNEAVHIGVYPSVLRKRYNVSDTVGTHPANAQSVAQFLEQYFSQADLAEFMRLWGGSFPHRSAIDKVLGPNDGRSGIEASLDTQYITSLGANVTTWFWSTGGRHQSQEPFLEWMVDISNTTSPPWVHSVSYSDNEDTLDVDYMKRINAEFMKAGTRRLSFLFASGDNGAGCKKTKFRPMYPSSSPYVTTVGGTAFKDPFTVSGEYGYEISGGGFSFVFPQASYQAKVVENYLKNEPKLPDDSYYNKAGRAFPDIAALSNHFWIVNNRVPAPGVAGTSASTPTVAGIISLLNDARLHNGKTALGFLNPFIYANPKALYDVTTGHNEGCLAHDTGFYASPGWDPVTGNGSPNFPELLKAALSLP